MQSQLLSRPKRVTHLPASRSSQRLLAECRSRLARTGRLSLYCCLVSVVLLCRTTQLDAQELHQFQSSAAKNSLFTPSDALLGALFIGSFLFIEQAPNFEMQVSRSLSGGEVLGSDSPHRVAPRAIGSLPFGLALTGGTYVFGRVSGNSTLQRTGVHALWTFLATDIATRLIKNGVGRARPLTNSGPDNFDAFQQSNDYNSFPSGHSSHAFALARTFSRELKDDAPWVPFVAYPLATWTAVSRVMDRKHWLTDVVAGAALGILVSNVVDRQLHQPDDDAGALRWGLIPGLEGGIGLGVSAPAPAFP